MGISALLHPLIYGLFILSWYSSFFIINSSLPIYHFFLKIKILLTIVVGHYCYEKRQGSFKTFLLNFHGYLTAILCLFMFFLWLDSWSPYGKAWFIIPDIILFALYLIHQSCIIIIFNFIIITCFLKKLSRVLIINYFNSLQEPWSANAQRQDVRLRLSAFLRHLVDLFFVVVPVVHLPYCRMGCRRCVPLHQNRRDFYSQQRSCSKLNAPVLFNTIFFSTINWDKIKFN